MASVRVFLCHLLILLAILVARPKSDPFFPSIPFIQIYIFLSVVINPPGVLRVVQPSPALSWSRSPGERKKATFSFLPVPSP